MEVTGRLFVPACEAFVGKSCKKQKRSDVTGYARKMQGLLQGLVQGMSQGMKALQGLMQGLPQGLVQRLMQGLI